MERLGARFAVRKRAVLVAAPLAVIALRLALFPVLPLPTPTCHDEFSYLLAGDTFAHGRLANPPHPMWLFLDTFHVLQHPTYASIFPPGQGAALALGEILGHPWIGVLLSMALMTAALSWMLQGWLPAKWALLGVVLIMFRIVIFSYWMESYWGGAVAATGGALVLGALPRIFKYYCSRDALIMGAGALLLANSRPYEGFLFCVPVGIAMIARLCSSRSPAVKVTGERVLLPLVCVLALTAVSLAYYDWRVTGNPLLLPHVLYDTQYINYRVLIWEKLHPPLQYANRQFELYFNVGCVALTSGARSNCLSCSGSSFWERALYRLCRDTALDGARPPGSISVDPVRFQHCRVVARRRNFPAPPSGDPSRQPCSYCWYRRFGICDAGRSKGARLEFF